MLAFPSRMHLWFAYAILEDKKDSIQPSFDNERRFAKCWMGREESWQSFSIPDSQGQVCSNKLSFMVSFIGQW